MQLSISNSWVAPIEVPGHGVIFPQLGVEAIPIGAIDYLLGLGYLISLGTKESAPEENKPKRPIKSKPPEPEKNGHSDSPN